MSNRAPILVLISLPVLIGILAGIYAYGLENALYFFLTMVISVIVISILVRIAGAIAHSQRQETHAQAPFPISAFNGVRAYNRGTSENGWKVIEFERPDGETLYAAGKRNQVNLWIAEMKGKPFFSGTQEDAARVTDSWSRGS